MLKVFVIRSLLAKTVVTNFISNLSLDSLSVFPSLEIMRLNNNYRSTFQTTVFLVRVTVVRHVGANRPLKMRTDLFPIVPYTYGFGTSILRVSANPFARPNRYPYLSIAISYWSPYVQHTEHHIANTYRSTCLGHFRWQPWNI